MEPITQKDQEINKNDTSSKLNLKGSDKKSPTSGGTANFLKEERAKASFNVKDMIYLLDGGKKANARKHLIWSPIKTANYNDRYGMTRAQLMKDHIGHFIKAHKAFPNIQITNQDVSNMTYVASIGGSSLANHMMLFCWTLINNCDEKQAKFWVKKAMNFEIVGCYAQTELGHGSNVRGLETIAVYDSKTEEFVLNTPTLTSRKWWPGALGRVGTHACVYAQLIMDGKEYGVHVFLVQIRDENHKPMPGMEMGDLGQKMGDSSNDTGYLTLKDVRIPRTFLLSRFSQVTPQGEYKASKMDSKLHYSTMMFTRAGMVVSSASRLAYASIITVRYNAVRRQGFVDTTTKSHQSPEHCILDYRLQQMRIFKQLANCFAMRTTGNWMMARLSAIQGSSLGMVNDTRELKEIAAMSAGLKALCTYLASSGMEELRKCCGGNGYLLSSGIAQMSLDFLWQVTAEGDYMILSLLTSKFLMKSVANVMGGKVLGGIMSYLNVLSDPSIDIVKARPANASNKSQFNDLKYLNDLFRYRSLVRVGTAAKNFQERIMGGKSMDEATNQSAYELLLAAKAHSFLVMLESFKNWIESIAPKDEKCKIVMHRLCALYACQNIIDDDWNGLLEPNQYSLAKENVYDLLELIRPDAVSIVDSFELPDNVLSSTIGRYDGNVYEALVEEAAKSELNKTEVFEGYSEVLRPHLDLELLKRGNKPVETPKL